MRHLASLMLMLVFVSGGARAEELVTQTREVGAFHAIELRSAADVEIAVGPVQSLEIRAEQRTLDRLVTRVEDETLFIEHERHTWLSRSEREIHIRITMPSLTRFALSGAGDVDIAGLSGGPLALAINGAGNIKAKGNLDTLKANINGAGNIDLRDVPVREVIAGINGTGSIDVKAAEALEATLNGVGSITYEGTPSRLSTSVNGVGSIKQR